MEKTTGVSSRQEVRRAVPAFTQRRVDLRQPARRTAAGRDDPESVNRGVNDVAAFAPGRCVVRVNGGGRDLRYRAAQARHLHDVPALHEPIAFPSGAKNTPRRPRGALKRDQRGIVEGLHEILLAFWGSAPTTMVAPSGETANGEPARANPTSAECSTRSERPAQAAVRNRTSPVPAQRARARRSPRGPGAARVTTTHALRRRAPYRSRNRHRRHALPRCRSRRRTRGSSGPRTLPAAEAKRSAGSLAT